MSTKVVKVDPLIPDTNLIKRAAKVLNRGGLVIIPTETVYGIAANMLNQKTMDRLYRIKKRPRGKPFSLHIGKKEDVENFAQDIPAAAYRLMDKFWPGPLTLVLNLRNNCGIENSLCLGGQDSRAIGIRMPDEKIALSIINGAKVPVVCPSANISGNPAPSIFQEAIKDLEGLVDFAVDAGPTRLGVESSVVDLTQEQMVILRQGAIKREDLQEQAGRKSVLFVCTGNSCRSVMAERLLKKKLKELGREDVEVSSAGVVMLGGSSASKETAEVLAKEGIDVSDHLSQALSKWLIKRSDIILAMEKAHEDIVLQMSAEAKNRVFLLKEFAKIDDNNLHIEDPIGKSREFYERTMAVIKEAVEKVSKII